MWIQFLQISIRLIFNVLNIDIRHREVSWLIVCVYMYMKIIWRDMLLQKENANVIITPTPRIGEPQAKR